MNIPPTSWPLDIGQLTRPKAVILDWDNTLIDSWLAIQDAQNHTFASFGMEPWSLQEIRERVRGSMRDTYPQLFGERWREAGDIFYRRFAERHLETLSPLPGAEQMLEGLYADGFYLAVVSNKKGTTYVKKLFDSDGIAGLVGLSGRSMPAMTNQPLIQWNVLCREAVFRQGMMSGLLATRILIWSVRHMLDVFRSWSGPIRRVGMSLVPINPRSMLTVA